MDNTIYDTISLPNGGTIMLDKAAYDTCSGSAISSTKKDNTHSWNYTLYFEDNDNNRIKTAAININKQLR